MKRIQISEPPKETFGRDLDCFEVSDECGEAIKKLIEADKPKFEPIQIDAFRVQVWQDDSKHQYPIMIWVDNKNDVFTTQKAQEIVSAIQSAKAFVEANQ